MPSTHTVSFEGPRTALGRARWPHFAGGEARVGVAAGPGVSFPLRAEDRAGSPGWVLPAPTQAAGAVQGREEGHRQEAGTVLAVLRVLGEQRGQCAMGG